MISATLVLFPSHLISIYSYLFNNLLVDLILSWILFSSHLQPLKKYHMQFVNVMHIQSMHERFPILESKLIQANQKNKKTTKKWQDSLSLVEQVTGS